jgi:flagellar biosynthesis/type III secretory pathway chaperone
LNGEEDIRRGPSSTDGPVRPAGITIRRKDAMNQDLDFLYKSLYLSMEQEHERYQELLEAVEEETDTLISCTSADIIDFNSRNERLLLSVKMASELRVNAIKKITSCLHLDEPVTMSQLIAYAPDKTRQNLIDYKEKFADLILKIQKTNNHNRELIAASLSHIKYTLNYIDNLRCSTPHYDRHGQIRAGNLQSRLISEAG